MTPGGYSNVADVNANTTAVNPDAGVKWWLEAMQAAYGAWGSAGSDGGAPDAGSADAGCSCDLGARSDKPGFGLASILVLALGLVLRRRRVAHPGT
jgi:MYXO-CTERM domain-containing protein